MKFYKLKYDPNKKYKVRIVDSNLLAKQILRLMYENEDDIFQFINDFEKITDCFYNSGLNTIKADEYYRLLKNIKNIFERIFEE